MTFYFRRGYRILICVALTLAVYCVCTWNTEHYAGKTACGMVLNEEPTDAFTRALAAKINENASCDLLELRDIAAVYCNGDVRAHRCANTNMISCRDARGQGVAFSAAAPCGYAGRFSTDSVSMV